MKLNLTQASRAAGISRSTRYRHIRKGRVSVEIDGDGERCIDVSELIRCYGEVAQVWNTPGDTPRAGTTQGDTPADTPLRRPRTDDLIQAAAKVATLEAENEALRRRQSDEAAILRERVRELEADKARLFDLVERQSLLLTEGKRDSQGKRPGPRREGAKNRLSRWWYGDETDHDYKRKSEDS